MRKAGKGKDQGASGREVVGSTCALGWEEEAGIHLRKRGKGRSQQELTGYSPQGHVQKGKERTKWPEARERVHTMQGGSGQRSNLLDS